MKNIFVVLLIAISASLTAQELGEFTLIGENQQAVIYLSKSEPECVQLAVQDLVKDIEKITGRTLKISSNIKRSRNGIYIKTKPDTTLWEAYTVKSENGSLFVTGSDERGTMFGIYHFIEEYLEVDPMYFWSGLEPNKREKISWENVNITSKGPSVKFRGWFINDEDLLTFWKEGGGKRNLDYKFYSNMINVDAIRPVVEALVRSRYNLIIPASFIDILNPDEESLIKECARRGIFISQHHQEPMGVSPFAYFNYWNKKGKEVQYSYISNKNEIQQVWREATTKWAKYPNVIWQLGLRGIGDRAIWESDKNVSDTDKGKGKLISDALADQMEILNEICPSNNPKYTSMTLWAEGSVLNQKGYLEIPKGTIIVFSDNSPGWKWQEDFYSTTRNSNNSYGVYYHHALIGSGPHLAQAIPPEQTFGLLEIAKKHNSLDYAIFNVSNIREFVLGIDATKAMTWDMDSYNPSAWFDQWINLHYSSNQSEIMNAYKIYFNSYQIHDKQHIPFLLDGHLFSQGKKCLIEMEKKIVEAKIGMGTDKEEIFFKGEIRRTQTKSSLPEGDAFWLSLKDAIPEQFGRRETIKRIAAQNSGFELASLHISGLTKDLPQKEAQFLFDNLVFPNNMMLRTGNWLKYLYLAHEALDLGKIQECNNYLVEAEKSIKEVELLANKYCYGKWEHWYRGERILNISFALRKTSDILSKIEHN